MECRPGSSALTTNYEQYDLIAQPNSNAFTSSHGYDIGTVGTSYGFLFSQNKGRSKINGNKLISPEEDMKKNTNEEQYYKGICLNGETVEGMERGKKIDPPSNAYM